MLTIYNLENDVKYTNSKKSVFVTLKNWLGKRKDQQGLPNNEKSRLSVPFKKVN